MKDFAKSIVCNSVTEKEFNTEADLRRWCMDHNYTYTPVGGGYYRLEDDKPGSKRPDLEAHVKAGNSKVGNGIKEDMKRAHPSDSIVDDVKASATYEAIVKQPWRVYDILGVGDSEIREYAFELIAKKYGVDYDTIYYAWLHSGYKLSDHKGPSNQEKAKRDFQKLGVSVSNTKTGNSKVGNEKISYKGIEIELYGSENGMYSYKYEIKQNKGKKNVPLGGQGRATLDSIKRQIDEDLAVSKTSNSKVGNFTIGEGVKGKEELNTKYKNNLRIAKEALSRISRKISGYENASNINWGHLGDIARIADLLSEI